MSIANNPQLKSLIANPPSLHYWDSKMNHGGFASNELTELYENLLCKLPPDLHIIETGAGNTSLLFMCLAPLKLFSIIKEQSEGLQQRILDYIRDNNFPRRNFELINEHSETALPKIADSGFRADLALIDGGHGWPTVFVDFCYINMMLKKDAYLIIDDNQLYSVRQLSQLLKYQPGWEVTYSSSNGKLIIFQKKTDEKFLPDFYEQPYIINSSKT